MPRFSDQTREAIQAALLREGERLFSIHGLKKVTADDLAAAVNISKGSYYSFYQNKEHLFMAVNFSIQDRLFEEVRQELEQRKALPPKELAMHIFKHLFARAAEHPILSKIDKDTMIYIQRKLPAEMIASHTRDDTAMVAMLAGYGITFTTDNTLIAKTLQTIFGCANLLIGDEDNDKVLEILLSSVVNLIA